jgi:hypothetical protein
MALLSEMLQKQENLVHLPQDLLRYLQVINLLVKVMKLKQTELDQ